MTLETLLSFSPFLALIFVILAVVQASRRRHQGFGAALLALIVIVAPLAGYLLTTDATLRSSLIVYMAVNAAVVLIASIVVLRIERRDPERDMNRSYGMLGIGLSILLAVGMFVTPMLAQTTSSSGAASVIAVNANDGLINVSAITPGAPLNQNTTQEAIPSFGQSPAGNGTFAPPKNGANPAQASATPSVPEATAQSPTAQPTAQPPTATIIRPTQIVFATATPMPLDQTAEATAEATSDAALATCPLVVDYNLNLRDKPTTDGSTVLLSIPFGTDVTADGHTADGWYSVSYDGQSGWVSGDYVTARASCSSLHLD